MKNENFSKITRLAKEAFKFGKYKSMNKVLAIVIGILLWPVGLAFVLRIGGLYIKAFVLSIIEEPLDRIYNFFHKEGQEVKHATQFIIYFISWSLVFGFKIVIEFIRLGLVVNYAFASIIGWCWTLGGYKFHISMDEADISKTFTKKAKKVEAVEANTSAK